MTDDGGPRAAGVHTAMLEAVEHCLDELADRISARLMKGRERMINQTMSDLGPKRHRDAVKRRMVNGEGGAGRAGRNYLLTPQALLEELARDRARPTSAPPPKPTEPAQKTRAQDVADFERALFDKLRKVKD